MCINRSQRHYCLQGTLIGLLCICVIGFGAIITIYLGVYYSTEQIVGLRPQRNINEDDQFLSSQSESHSLIKRLLRKRSNYQQQTTATESFEEKLVTTFYRRNCPWNEWIVQSSILLDQCPYIPPQMPFDSMNNVQFKNCLRKYNPTNKLFHFLHVFFIVTKFHSNLSECLVSFFLFVC